MKEFPLGHDLMGLMLVSMANVNEPHRLSFTSATVNRKLKVPSYTFENVTEAFTKLFCASETAVVEPEDEGEQRIDEENTFGVKGTRGGKPKGRPDSQKGSPSTDSHPKGGGKLKGNRKPWKDKGSANTAENVSNSSSFITEIPSRSPEKNKTFLSKSCFPLRKRKGNMINLSVNPTAVILDPGCTRHVGSRRPSKLFSRLGSRKESMQNC